MWLGDLSPGLRCQGVNETLMALPVTLLCLLSGQTGTGEGAESHGGGEAGAELSHLSVILGPRPGVWLPLQESQRLELLRQRTQWGDG